jgi:hypothetical protein
VRALVLDGAEHPPLRVVSGADPGPEVLSVRASLSHGRKQ